MRPWLRWLLIASVLLSAAALLWPQGTHVAQVAEAVQAKVIADREDAVSPQPVATPATNLDIPESLTKVQLPPATFDPFVGVVPPPPKAPPPPPEPVVQAPPPPTAPPINYRYLGQMVAPDGNKLIYLANSEKELLVTRGTKLDEGYIVEVIQPDGVHLTYPPLGTKVLIPAPERSTN